MIKKELERVCKREGASCYSTVAMDNSRITDKTSADFEAYTYDWGIGINRKVLKFVGLWTYPKSSEWRNVVSNIQTFTFIFGTFIFLTFPQVWALVMVWGHFELIIENIVTNLPFAIAALKLAILRIEKSKLATLIERIEEDWNVDKIEEKKVMLKYWNLSHIITIGGFAGAVLATISNTAQYVSGHLSREITNITDIEGRIFLYQTFYPFDYRDNMRFQLTRASQFTGVVFAIFGFTGPDVIFGMIVLHACSQFENLANKFENMVNDEPDTFHRLMEINIRRHYQLIRFVKKIEDVFSLLLLMILGVLSLILCVECIPIINLFSKNWSTRRILERLSFYVTFSIYFLFLIFMYCWVGENLVTQSSSLQTAIFNCNWTILKPKQYLQLQLILLRSAQPLELTAGGLFPITLNTFIKVLRTTASYISLLRAVKD